MKKGKNGRLHLASSSPRRVELLRALGLEFSAGGADVDETPAAGETAEQMVLRLAAAKAAAAGVEDDTVVIGADTAVVLGERIFGKPVDRHDALSMLEALSDRVHRVVTGVAVRSAAGIVSVLSASEVRFRAISAEEALAYWQSGEPRGKAGAYAIQGLGGVFVASLSGSYTGVVGLPVYETASLLGEAGIDVLAGPRR